MGQNHINMLPTIVTNLFIDQLKYYNYYHKLYTRLYRET